MIRRRSYWLALLPAVLCAGALYAQQYPVMNMIADRVIQKYQSASCEHSGRRGSSRRDEEKNLVQLLQAIRYARRIHQQVAAPIANKMFECAMIP